MVSATSKSSLPPSFSLEDIFLLLCMLNELLAMLKYYYSIAIVMTTPLSGTMRVAAWDRRQRHSRCCVLPSLGGSVALLPFSRLMGIRRFPRLLLSFMFAGLSVWPRGSSERGLKPESLQGIRWRHSRYIPRKLGLHWCGNDCSSQCMDNLHDP